jgi:hypothetical protein
LNDEGFAIWSMIAAQSGVIIANYFRKPWCGSALKPNKEFKHIGRSRPTSRLSKLGIRWFLFRS